MLFGMSAGDVNCPLPLRVPGCFTVPKRLQSSKIELDAT